MHTSQNTRSLIVATFAACSLAACGDQLPGDLPPCDVDESAIEWTLDADDKLAVNWAGAHQATYLAVADLDAIDDDGVPTNVYWAGGTCSTYLVVAADATCLEDSTAPIAASPLRTADFEGGAVPSEGEPTLVRGQPYALELHLSLFDDGNTTPSCRSYIEAEKTF